MHISKQNRTWDSTEDQY